MWISRHLLGFDTTQQRRKPDVDLRAWVLKQTLSRDACPLLVPVKAYVLTEIYRCVTGDVPVDILHASAFVDVVVLRSRSAAVELPLRFARPVTAIANYEFGS
jgi:hypothetical protein